MYGGDAVQILQDRTSDRAAALATGVWSYLITRVIFQAPSLFCHRRRRPDRRLHAAVSRPRVRESVARRTPANARRSPDDDRGRRRARGVNISGDLQLARLGAALAHVMLDACRSRTRRSTSLARLSRCPSLRDLRHAPRGVALIGSAPTPVASLPAVRRRHLAMLGRDTFKRRPGDDRRRVVSPAHAARHSRRLNRRIRPRRSAADTRRRALLSYREVV